jgi:esterase
VPRIRVNGVALYYEEHGSGEPILCIHGIGSSAAVWGDAAAELGKHGRTIVYDRRGSFRSERPDPYVTSVPQHADDAAALLEALDAAPAVVIGRSYGGEVAIELALRYPERVRALALLETAEVLTEAGARWLAELGERVLAAAESDMGSVAETLYRTALGDETWEGMPAEAKAMFAANGPAIVAEFRGGFLDVEVEQLGAVARPTLLVAGTDSPPVFAESTRLLAGAIPSSRVVWVEGGHLINPAHPAVLDFVDGVLAPG